MMREDIKFDYAPILDDIQDGRQRFSPSPVLRTAGLYYVWYSRAAGPTSRASICYATSEDGKMWTEQGRALTRTRKKDWDSGEVFNPSIMLANHFYWLFYVARRDGPLARDEAPAGLGLAFSESPAGPWERLVLNPILHPVHSSDLDCYRIDGCCVIARDREYWLYYRCSDYGEPGVRIELAIAQAPNGPYAPVSDRAPVFRDVRHATFWPSKDGVAAMCTLVDGRTRLYFSTDGRTFEETGDLSDPPAAPAPFREDAFAFTPFGAGISWGICESIRGMTRKLQHFDCNLRAD